MSHETPQTETTDAARPSWATHELAALALTVVLAVWVVAKWGATVQPVADTERGEKRAEELAKLHAADEKVLNNFGVADESLKRYRIPIQNAMTLVAELGAENISKEVAVRTAPPSELKLVEIPDPDFLADVSELDNPGLITQGKILFQTRICFTCHQTDPAVPAPAGLALKAPNFIGDFWGKERLVHKGMGGPLERVIMGPGYFAESVSATGSGARVVKGAVSPMPPPPPVTEEEVKALMAYVRSLSAE
ncbi:MAG: cytochrome c [Verrucomicrobia subdivision 3 bacterium]|nr:cytochrome c [Limisphaerales bacterium]